MRAMQEEKESLVMSSIYLYEGVLRKIDVKIDEIQSIQIQNGGSDSGDAVPNSKKTPHP